MRAPNSIFRTLSAIGCVIALGSCAGGDPQDPVPDHPAFAGGQTWSGSSEGEIIGWLVSGSAASKLSLSDVGTNAVVNLIPRDTETANRHYGDAVHLSQHAIAGQIQNKAHWHYWDPSNSDGPCTPAPGGSYASDGPGYDEFHSTVEWGPGKDDPQYETHCARPGRYTFSIEYFGVSIPVDYFHVRDGLDVQADYGGVIANASVEAEGITSTYIDLHMMVDVLGNRGLAETPALAVDAVDPGSIGSSFPNPASIGGLHPRGASTQTFRFATWASGSAWGVPQHHLVRIFWDLSDLSQRTGYFSADAPASTPALRVHSYPAPPAPYTSCLVEYGVEILRPDEMLAGLPSIRGATSDFIDESQIHRDTIEVTNGGTGTPYDGLCASIPAPTFVLTVGGQGLGSGSVSTAGGASGIDCQIEAGMASGDCSEAFTSGTVVQLAASPSLGHSFSGWSGDCQGGTCSVSMTQTRSVTATFLPPPPPQIVDFTGPVACEQKTNFRFLLDWSVQGTYPFGTSWELYHGSTSSQSAATTTGKTGGMKTTDVWTPYYAPNVGRRYFWLKVTPPGEPVEWYALDAPIYVGSGCAV